MFRSYASLVVLPLVAAVALMATPGPAHAASTPIVTLSASRAGDTVNYRLGGLSFVPGAFVGIEVSYAGGHLSTWTTATQPNLPASPGGYIDSSFSLKVPRGTQVSVQATEVLYDSMGQRYFVKAPLAQTSI